MLPFPAKICPIKIFTRATPGSSLVYDMDGPLNPDVKLLKDTTWRPPISYTLPTNFGHDKKVEIFAGLTFSLEAPVCSRFCKDLLPEAQVLGPTQGIERSVNQTAITLPLMYARWWGVEVSRVQNTHFIESRLTISLFNCSLKSFETWKRCHLCTKPLVTWNVQYTRSHLIRFTVLFPINFHWTLNI